MSCLKNRKRAVSFILVVFAVLTFSLVTTVSADESSSYGIITASALNVRQEPSTEAHIVSTLPNGTYVKVNWLQPGWANITYSDTIYGYVSLDYITIHAGEMPSRAAVSSQGQAVVEYAKQFLGTPYVYGGSSPSGFDCSGFTSYVYRHFGITLNRVTTGQMQNGTWVAKNELQPGDIVGFYSQVGGSYVGHVGIYAGNGMMIHSPHTGDVVKYESIMTGTYARRYAAGRRIF